MQNEALWEASMGRKQACNMGLFRTYLEQATGRRLTQYRDLHAFSVEDVGRFWGLAEAFLQVKWRQKSDQSYRPSLNGGMLGAEWFPGSKLSWTENLLPGRDDPEPKIISIIEGLKQPIVYTGASLYEAVARCTALLQSLGVGSGDRVAAVLPNSAEAVIGMLATAALGAIWSSCSPDFGVSGIVDRFSQIQPKVLLMTRSYSYNSRVFDCRLTAESVRQQLDSVQAAIMIDPLQESGVPVSWLDWQSSLKQISPREVEAFRPIATDFNHPLYILYSSGTTGKPKCIVHSVGGTLLQHKKELMLHCDLGVGKRLLYFTTCGWMMWNWMASGLSVGASLVLFEGSVGQDEFSVLWRAVDEYGVHCFGTSPKFLAATEKANLCPGDRYPFSKLETLLSTGSPLNPEQFSWVYKSVKSNLHLASISGGTDIVSCFMLGNPLSPVYAGEIQGPGLGMALASWNEQGEAVIGQKGELVCTRPFPSMPLGFWGDPGEKYREAYFEFFPQQQVWRHGDFVEINDRLGIVVHGRSDATLNPGGIRIGTAEIYRQVEALSMVQDSLAVSRETNGDVEMVLFIRLKEGIQLDQDLKREICRLLREQLSPRHVPADLIQVADIPYTRSGKKLEIAVTRIINGQVIDNLAAIANPECLEEYRQYAPSLESRGT